MMNTIQTLENSIALVTASLTQKEKELEGWERHLSITKIFGWDQREEDEDYECGEAEELERQYLSSCNLWESYIRQTKITIDFLKDSINKLNDDYTLETATTLLSEKRKELVAMETHLNIKNIFGWDNIDEDDEDYNEVRMKKIFKDGCDTLEMRISTITCTIAYLRQVVLSLN